MRECRPSLPNALKKTSEAPLTTAGWPPKRGPELTNPATLTMRETLSSEPSSAFSCARALTAHSRAASSALSAPASSALPVCTRRPSAPTGSCPETNAVSPCTETGTYAPAGAGGEGRTMPISASLSSAPTAARRGRPP